MRTDTYVYSKHVTMKPVTHDSIREHKPTYSCAHEYVHASDATQVFTLAQGNTSKYGSSHPYNRVQAYIEVD